MTGLVKVLVVDDHALFRKGIVSVLSAQQNIQVVGEASQGLEAIQKAEELSPDVIVMDIQMPQCTGVEATRALQAKSCPADILILTVSEKEADLFEAIKAGAKGYLLKNVSPEELVAGVVSVARGESIISPVMATKLLAEFRAAPEARQGESPDLALSEREKEILGLVAEGRSNKDIAEALVIGETTVKTHLRHILEKLHLKNRSQAVAYALKKGLLSGKG